MRIGTGIRLGTGISIRPSTTAAIASGSLGFNGSSQYLRLASDAAFAFGTLK